MNRLYTFGDFRLDVGNRLLTRAGAPVAMAPKVFDLLVLLVENPGRLLDKERLLQSLWPDTFVEESNLSVNMSALRKALGEQPGQAQFIETVPRKGYRFVAAVDATVPAEQPPPPSEPVRGPNRWLLAAAGIALLAVAGGTGYWFSRPKPESAAVRSMAVLPFRSLTRGESEDALSAGMADALIMKLTAVRQITVRPTHTILAYRDPATDPIAAGRALQVDAVLDGRIQREGKRIRISVQLMRVRDGVALWGARFDDSFTNLFAVQDSISERVADALSLHLSAAEKEHLRKRYTESTAAFEYYQMGQHIASRLTAADAHRALEYFDLARKEDPRYPLAYTGMAAAYVTLGTSRGGFTPELRKKSLEAAERALELDGRLAESHLAMAWVKMYADWDWSGAEQAFRRALELNGALALARLGYATLLTAMGRSEAAVQEMEAARHGDPGSVVMNTDLGWTLMYARRYREAVDQLRRALEMDASRIATRTFLIKALLLDRRYSEALDELAKPEAATLRVDKARALALAGRMEEARSLAAELRPSGPATDYSWALLEVALGDKKRALDRLEAAAQVHGSRLLWIKAEPEFDSIRDDPRFQALLRRVNLTE